MATHGVMAPSEYPQEKHGDLNWKGNVDVPLKTHDTSDGRVCQLHRTCRRLHVQIGGKDPVRHTPTRTGDGGN